MPMRMRFLTTAAPLPSVGLAFALFLMMFDVSIADESQAQNSADHANVVPLKNAKLMIFEDFESTAVGEIPAGFTKKGTISVAEGAAHSGTRALRLDAALRQSILIKSGPELAALGGRHWGRLFFRIQFPAPKPAHATIMSGLARSPTRNDSLLWNMVDLSVHKDQGYHFMYSGMFQERRREFNGGGKAVNEEFSADWTLVEWHIDHGAQSYRFFVNGVERKGLAVHPGSKNFERTEIPAKFESLMFGWVNHWGKLPEDDGERIVWIDDLAVGEDRIGDQVSQPVTKASQ